MNRSAVKLLIGMLGLLLICCGQATPAAAAAPAPPTYYEGTLNGGDIDNWTLWIATSGKEALGVTFGTGGPAPGDNLLGARAEGSVKKKGRSLSIDLKLYAVSTSDTNVRVGRIVGTTTTSGGFSGTFSLAGRNGSFTATPVVRDATRTTALTGNYEIDGDDVDAFLNLSSSGTFLLTGSVLNRSVGRASGFWLVDNSGYLWLLPTSIVESNEFFDLTIKLRVPLKMRATRNGDELELFDPIKDGHFATFTRQ